MNRPRILVVDDNPDDLRLVELALKRSGRDIRLDFVEDGCQACERLLAAGAAPDITILDVNLPLMNGFDVLRKVRAAPEGRDAVIVMMTSSSNPDDEKVAHAEGCSAFHVKPMGYHDFVALMSGILDRWLPGARATGAG